MRALAYAWQEALTSLARARWTLLLSIATIAVAFAMLGAFRVVSGTVGRVAGGWSEAAEVSVYLDDVVTGVGEPVRCGADDGGDAGVRAAAGRIGQDGDPDRLAQRGRRVRHLRAAGPGWPANRVVSGR